MIDQTIGERKDNPGSSRLVECPPTPGFITLPGLFRVFCAPTTNLNPFLSRQFYPIYSDVKKSKETGNFEDFIECLKLYDKMENGTMMLGELEHILLSLGES